MDLPRLKPHTALVPVSADVALLKGPATFLSYTGEAVPALVTLAPLLDGTRTIPQLAAQSGLSEEDTRDLVEALTADRALEDAALDAQHVMDPATRARLEPQLSFFSHLTRHPAPAQKRLHDARVLLVGTGNVADAFAHEAAALGIGHIERGDLGTLRAAVYTHAVLAADGPAPERFLAFNEAALAAGVPWTGAFLDGFEASIGPTVLPGQTACWRCYDLRVLGAHPSIERTLRYRKLAPPPAAFALPSFAPIVGAWTAQATLVAVSGAGLPPQAGHVTRVALLDLEARRHRVLRMPRCPSCAPDGGIPDIDRYALEPLEP